MNEELKNEEEVIASNDVESTPNEVKVKKPRRKKGDADGRINNDSFTSSIMQIEKDSLLSTDEIIEILKKAIRKAYLNYVYPETFKRDSTDPAKDLIDAEVSFERHFKEIKIYDIKIVTEESKIVDDAYQISEEEALQYSKKAKLGDKVKIPFDFSELPSKVARQSQIFFNNYLLDNSRQAITKVYSSQINGLIEGTVTRVEEGAEGGYKKIELSFGKASGNLLRKDLLPQDRFSINDKVLCYLQSVSNATNPPSLSVSRSNEKFVVKLLERAVPELEEGIVKIVAIARDPGKRTKIFVESTDKNIDPVGACIGPENSRIRAVLNELKGEKIDVLRYYENKALQIIEAMKPAIVTGLTCDEDFFDPNVHFNEIEQEKGYVFPDVTAVVMNGSTGVAIGLNGVNVRLASKITKTAISVLEADKAIEKAIDFKPVTAIKDMVKELYPDEVIEDKFANINATAPSIDYDEDEDFEDEIEANEDDVNKKEVSEVKVEQPVKKEETAPVKEEKEDASNNDEEEHITIVNKPKLGLSQLENILDNNKKKQTATKSYKKKVNKKKDEEEETYTPVENAMPIYTEDELKEMENDSTEEDYNDFDEDDYSEYDSDEYYDK